MGLEAHGSDCDRGGKQPRADALQTGCCHRCDPESCRSRFGEERKLGVLRLGVWERPQYEGTLPPPYSEGQSGYSASGHPWLHQPHGGLDARLRQCNKAALHRNLNRVSSILGAEFTQQVLHVAFYRLFSDGKVISHNFV